MRARYSVIGIILWMPAVDRVHPLAAEPKGAAMVFFALWPGLTLAAAILVKKRFS